VPVKELMTERLAIVPLSAELLRLGLEDPGAFAVRLGLAEPEQEPDEGLRAAQAEMLRLVEENPVAYEWYTDWQIVSREERLAVGGLCFKGPPGEDGAVEVGYGLHPPFRGCGVMTEALHAAVQWAFRHPEVQCVTAEVEADNLASVRALRRVGMSLSHEAEGFQQWRLCRSVWASLLRG
jgi:RimJ/RimL family protein N-acetyltransferase